MELKRCTVIDIIIMIMIIIIVVVVVVVVVVKHVDIQFLRRNSHSFPHLVDAV